MKVLITGSGSFVGKELINQCLKKNISVIGCDTIDAKYTHYDFYKINICSQEIPLEIFENVDSVIHLAALSRDSDCKGRSYDCFNTNVMGTLNLIKYIKKTKVKQFIFASSEWVYDKFDKNEEKDEESLIDVSNLNSEYALSKLVSECNLRQEFNNNFCDVTILRFGIIYGPRTNNWSAVESIASTIKNKDEITVGSLKNARRFIHISDICNGIIKSIGLKGFNILNLSGEQLITMENLIVECETIYGKKILITEKEPLTINMRNPSNKKAKQILNWKPEITLIEGLKSLNEFL